MLTRSAGDLLRTVYPPRYDILSPWLLDRELAMVYAWRGVGKTFFALCLALSIAGGIPFLGWKPSRSRKVFYADGEMGEANIQSRLLYLIESWKEAGEVEEEFLKFLSFERCGKSMWDLADKNDQAKYTDAIGDADVVIIDNLSTCIKGKPRESEIETWHRVQEWLIAQRSADKTIILIHHAGKSGAQRGISNREDVLDTVVALRRPQSYEAANGCEFEIHWEKTRNFKHIAKPLYARLLNTEDNGGVWLYEDLKEWKERKVRALSAEGYSNTDIAASAGLAPSDVKLILSKTYYGGKYDE